MGRRVYLSDAEVRVLNEALSKWDNWAWESMEEWERDARDKLFLKLAEDHEIRRQS